MVWDIVTAYTARTSLVLLIWFLLRDAKLFSSMVAFGTGTVAERGVGHKATKLIGTLSWQKISKGTKQNCPNYRRLDGNVWSCGNVKSGTKVHCAAV